MTMFIRPVAYKLNIKDIVSNTVNKKEGEADSIQFQNLKISRTNVMGTVVQAFVSQNENYMAFTIDDGTETIRCKIWRNDDNSRTMDFVKNLTVGTIVDIVGRIREYNEEKYINPETIVKIDDFNAEIARKLEITKFKKNIDKIKQEESKPVVVDNKTKILNLIKTGIKTLDSISEKINLNTEECKKEIINLMDSGLVYEPKKGEYAST